MLAETSSAGSPALLLVLRHGGWDSIPALLPSGEGRILGSDHDGIVEDAVLSETAGRVVRLSCALGVRAGLTNYYGW